MSGRCKPIRIHGLSVVDGHDPFQPSVFEPFLAALGVDPGAAS